MKTFKKTSYYIIFLILGIFIAYLYNLHLNKNIDDSKTMQTDIITRTVESSGTRFSTFSCKGSKTKQLHMVDNSVEFILEIYNFERFNKSNNVISMFVNNIQVCFEFNDKHNKRKHEFNLNPKSNCFKIKINNLKTNKKQNDLLIIISKKDASYDVMSNYEEKYSNLTNFINLKLLNYSIEDENNIQTEYQDYDCEKDIEIKNGIYLNQSFNGTGMDGSPFVKCKVNERIYIPTIIKNEEKYKECSIIFLVEDEQYKLYDKDYINIKLNNALSKYMCFCIKSPIKKGNYKIKAVMICKNKKDKKNFISNTINLIVE